MCSFIVSVLASLDSRSFTSCLAKGGRLPKAVHQRHYGEEPRHQPAFRAEREGSNRSGNDCDPEGARAVE